MSSDSTSTLPPTDLAAGKNAGMWAMLCHLTALSFYIGVPLGNIVGPLIVWLIKRNEIPLVDDQGKESLNFQISVLIYGVVCVLLVFVVIGFPLLVALVLFHLIMTVIATVKSNQGIAYRYPLCIRFIN